MTITTHSIEQVERIVCRYLGVEPYELRGRKSRDKAWKKHLLVYCLYKFTPESLFTIREHVGVHHTQIMKSVKLVGSICAVSPDKRNQVIELESLFE